MRSVDSLVWYVFYHDPHAGEIVAFNIFHHASFMKDIKSFLTKRMDRPIMVPSRESRICIKKCVFRLDCVLKG